MATPDEIAQILDHWRSTGVPLNARASPEQIAARECECGLTIPEPLRLLYQEATGMPEGTIRNRGGRVPHRPVPPCEELLCQPLLKQHYLGRARRWSGDGFSSYLEWGRVLKRSQSRCLVSLRR